MSSSPRSSPSPSYFEAIPVRITLNNLADLVGHPKGWVAVAFEGHFYRQGVFVPISIRGAKFTAGMATEQLAAGCAGIRAYLGRLYRGSLLAAGLVGNLANFGSIHFPFSWLVL